MGNIATNAVLIELRNAAIIYKEAIEFDTIEKYSFIIEVGELTVGTNEQGRILIQNTHYPTQFSSEAAKDVLQCKFRNGKGKLVQPKVRHRNDWYSIHLKEVDELIKVIESRN